MTEPNYEGEPSLDVDDALKLVLLFHGGGAWDDAKIAEWFRITGTREATTKVLCDHLRSMLALMGADNGHDPQIHARLGDDIAHGERIGDLADKFGRLKDG
jgi:hypothetical protein